jgi:branched-chain amino acid transport system substrate-binding protein
MPFIALIGVVVAATILATTAGAVSGKASADPIKLAGISTVSGGIPFVGIPPGAKAYFDLINSRGGVQGRKIEYTSYDDKADPAEAAQLARKIVLQDNVDAVFSNTSLVDCDTNEKFYEQQKLGVIGLGPQPTCFNSPNWMPINPGPYVGTIVLYKFAFENLKLKRVCDIGQNEPTSIPYYKQLATWYRTKTGHKLTMLDFSNDPSKNPTPQVVKAKRAKCDALIIHTVAPNFVAFVKAAKAVGFDGTILCLGSAYDASVPKSLGKLANPGGLGPKSKGLFVNSEFAPWTTADPALKEMRDTLTKAGVPIDFWSQSGWIMAEMFVYILKQINGEINRDSIYQKMLTMKPFVTPQSGSPLVFGPGKTHAPNRSSRMITIRGGKWVPVDKKWTIVPPLPAPA